MMTTTRCFQLCFPIKNVCCYSFMAVFVEMTKENQFGTEREGLFV